LAGKSHAVARAAIEVGAATGPIALTPQGTADVIVALLHATLGSRGAFFAIRFARGAAADAIVALL
jgi:hypothetical protein